MIGLIAAMPSEKKAVVERMKEISHCKVGPVEMTAGSIGSQKVVIALSGVGKVAAAMTAALMILEYQPEALINVGAAGGLLETQKVQDMVISDEIIEADFDTTPIDGPQGLGKIFHTDKELQKKAIETAEAMQISYSVGAVASQDLFMARDEDFEKLKNNFPQAACSEMEGAAIAQVAASFHIPVLILRSLSDVVSESDNSVVYDQFVLSASQRAADFIQKFCE